MSAAGVDLLGGLLTYDPRKRLSALAALRHPYFGERPLPRLPQYMPTFPSGERAGGPCRQPWHWPLAAVQSAEGHTGRRRCFESTKPAWQGGASLVPLGQCAGTPGPAPCADGACLSLF